VSELHGRVLYADPKIPMVLSVGWLPAPQSPLRSKPSLSVLRLFSSILIKQSTRYTNFQLASVVLGFGVAVLRRRLLT
jgi:hypothetical protein